MQDFYIRTAMVHQLHLAPAVSLVLRPSYVMRRSVIVHLFHELFHHHLSVVVEGRHEHVDQWV